MAKEQLVDARRALADVDPQDHALRVVDEHHCQGAVGPVSRVEDVGVHGAEPARRFELSAATGPGLWRTAPDMPTVDNLAAVQVWRGGTV
jgi:hypothetical protein